MIKCVTTGIVNVEVIQQLIDALTIPFLLFFFFNILNFSTIFFCRGGGGQILEHDNKIVVLFLLNQPSTLF